MISAKPLSYFLCEREDIEQRIARIDPRGYDKTRNHLNGQVTWLSPFLTHGISSTHEIAESVLRHHKAKAAYRLLYELAWREYFHRTWQRENDAIFHDMRQPQQTVLSQKLPRVITQAATGIDVVDECLNQLMREGTLHNHARMWIAAIISNMAGTNWPEPARWMHYHLLDGDLASNTLSWQWIAGTFSHKQYVANQQNINKYSNHEQNNSWLDIPYEAFDQFNPPTHLLERTELEFETALPGKPINSLPNQCLHGQVALRSLWQLDPRWQTEIDQHIVFIDSDLSRQWPMSKKRWAFIEHWSERCNAQIVHGTVDDLDSACRLAHVTREEYPACKGWPGNIVQRRWLYPEPDSTYQSFSQFFKQVKISVGL